MRSIPLENITPKRYNIIIRDYLVLNAMLEHKYTPHKPASIRISQSELYPNPPTPKSQPRPLRITNPIMVLCVAGIRGKVNHVARIVQRD
jgi:hypothetical protein